jgi:hypothetical protein
MPPTSVEGDLRSRPGLSDRSRGPIWPVRSSLCTSRGQSGRSGAHSIRAAVRVRLLHDSGPLARFGRRIRKNGQSEDP